MRENACPSLVAIKPAGKEHRYERLLVASPGPAADPIAALCEALGTIRPYADVDLLRRAYGVAAHYHQGQFRRSGDPYVTHPVSVATILAGLGADDQDVRRGLALEAQDVGKRSFFGFDDGVRMVCDQPAEHGVGMLASRR